MIDTVRANGYKSCYIRPIVYRGYGELGVDPFPCPVDCAILVWEWGQYLGNEALEKGVDVTPLDVINRSFVKKINPIIYDGANIPFKSKHFDKVLLLSVLHHTSNPENIIRESLRVSKNIIIVEDIYTNNFDKQFTFFMDSLWNLEFKDHPRSNKTDTGWRELFKKMDLTLKDVYYWNDIFFKHAVYYLEV